MPCVTFGKIYEPGHTTHPIPGTTPEIKKLRSGVATTRNTAFSTGVREALATRSGKHEQSTVENGVHDRLPMLTELSQTLQVNGSDHAHKKPVQSAFGSIIFGTIIPIPQKFKGYQGLPLAQVTGSLNNGTVEIAILAEPSTT